MKNQNHVSIIDSPTKSKVSTKISQSFVEIESDLNKKSLAELVSEKIFYLIFIFIKFFLLLTFTTQTSLDAENDDLNNPIKNLFVKVNVIIMKTSTQLHDEIKSLNIQVNEKTRVYDLIKMSLEIFNETFSKENLNYRLDPDYRLYSVKPSKKSGKPDKDLPSKFFFRN